MQEINCNNTKVASCQSKLIKWNMIKFFPLATFDLFGIAYIRACDSSVLVQTSLVLPYNWITTRAGVDNKHPMEDDPKIWKVEYPRHEKSYKMFSNQISAIWNIHTFWVNLCKKGHSLNVNVKFCWSNCGYITDFPQMSTIFREMSANQVCTVHNFSHLWIIAETTSRGLSIFLVWAKCVRNLVATIFGWFFFLSSGWHTCL